MALLDRIKSFFKKKDEDLQLTGSIPLKTQPIKIDANALSTPKIDSNLTGVKLSQPISNPLDLPSGKIEQKWNEPLQPVMDAADKVWNNPSVTKARNWLADRPIIDTKPMGVNITPIAGMPNIEIGKMGSVYTMGKDILQSLPRALLRMGLTRDQLGGSQNATIKPETKLEKLLFGEEEITSIQDGMKRAEAKLKEWGLKNEDVNKVLAGVGVIGGTALDLQPVSLSSGKKALVKNGDELATVLQKGLKIKTVALDNAIEPVKVAWKDAEAALKGFQVEKGLLKKLAKGEMIEGPTYVIKKQGKELIINIDNAFKPVEQAVAQAVTKAKGVRLGKTKPTELPKVDEVVEKVVDNTAPVVENAVTDIRYTDPKVFAKTIERGKAGGKKKIAELKLPEYWKPEEIDRAQVDQYKLSLQNGNKIDPIVVDPDGAVLDGAHRLTALQEMGITDVETVIQKPLTEKQMQKKMSGVRFGANKKMTDDAKQFNANQRMLEREAELEMGESADDILADFGQVKKEGEGVSFMAKAKEVAEKNDNEELLREAMAKVDPKLQTIEQFAEPVKETGILDNLSDKIGGAISNNKVYRAIADPVSDIVHKTVGKFRFADQDLDVDAKAIERAKIGFVEQSKRIYSEAKAEVESILGREINQEEAGALLRGNYRAERKMVREGVTNLPLGADITRRSPTLQKVFSQVHTEIASYVLMYEKELDDLVRTGKLTTEQAAKMRLVEPEQFGKNLDKYVRTFYNKEVQDFSTTPVNPFVVEETRINFSTAKRKLTDREWGLGYIQAMQQGHPEEVTRVTGLPDTSLVKRAMNGEKEAVSELGRQVKGMRGFVTQGDAVVERTVYNLLNSYRDLKLESMVADRDDLFSTTLKEGFVPIPKDNGYGPLSGKYVKEDLAKELFSDKEQIETTTDTVKNTIYLYGALWRYTKTVLNPATWVLNGLTGLLSMQTLAGNAVTNPKNWKYYSKALEILSEASKGTTNSQTLKQFIDLGGRGSTFVDVEIIGAIKEVFEQSDTPKLLEKLAEKTAYFAKQGEKLGEFYSYIDGYNKYATFLQKIDKGYTAIDAMKIADKYHLNYAVAPKFIRGIKQNMYASVLLPFASFPLMFSKMLVETAVTKPWRLAPMMLIPMAWNASWATRNPEMAEQAEAQKPEFLRGNPFVLTLGYDEQSKQFTYYDMSRIFNIPTTGDQGSRFFLGPFAGVGGPLATVSDVTKGIDSFGNPLNAPGIETTGEHLIKGLAPVPNLVFQVADLYKTVTGQPARGKMREPLDEALKIAGITIIRSGLDQMKKEVSGLEREYADWLTYTKRQLIDPRLSPDTRKKLITQLGEKKAKYEQEIAKRISKQVEDETAPVVELSKGIVDGIEQAANLPSLDLNEIPTADLPGVDLKGLTVQSPKKGVSLGKGTTKPKKVALPKSKGIKFSLPKEKRIAQLPDLPEIKAPPVSKGVRLSRTNPNKKVSVKKPTVRGLRVS